MAHATQTSKYAQWWSQMNGPDGPQKAGTAIAVLLVLGAGALVVPLPGPLLDLLLSANLAASLAVFALMLLAARPERIAGLPGLLVVSSLLRVTLAVAVGRHILLAGSGGTLVSGLGELAAGRSWAAGLFLVLMLAVIDMVVVGVGMVRVSEVLARFALDALPGRQMGIDNAVADGRLDREEAVSEQRRVEAESAFYGAMDGAARFLRGDCVATIVIVVATPLAALLTGTGREMTDLLTTAAGHGLAILLPGLLVGGAGAVALSRAGSSQSFGVEIAEQLVLQPAALIATSVVLLAIALVAPGARLPLIGMVVAVMAVAVAGLRSSGRRQAQTHARGIDPLHHPGVCVLRAIGLHLVIDHCVRVLPVMAEVDVAVVALERLVVVEVTQVPPRVCGGFSRLVCGDAALGALELLALAVEQHPVVVLCVLAAIAGVTRERALSAIE